MRKFCIAILACFFCVMSYATSYTVKYKVGDSHRTATLNLQGGTESEAKEKLIKQGSVSKKDRDRIIILEIKIKGKQTKDQANMKSYVVKFKVGNTYSTRTLSLYGGTESEAIEKLVSQGTVDRKRKSEIIILSITKS
ncbi:hypothetical protein LJC39_00950 [Parabacteroides sp. OttesenSCG-928-B22]|nr:hypothetical protein [Parabacteroides sp. OttesenSCG-928-B22]